MNYIEVYFNGVLKNSLPIQSETFRIGREVNNDLVINNMGVSSHHAIITQKDNQFFIEDLDSTNGSFLNSEKITSRQQINPHDTIIIGKHSIKFSDWSQTENNTSSQRELIQASADETVIINKSQLEKANQTTGFDPSQKHYYLMIKGELTGIKKLLLEKDHYSIGKANDNNIRLGGWFTPAYIAEIEKVRHGFYITPLKKNKVKINGDIINSRLILSNNDQIQIKNLSLRFLAD